MSITHETYKKLKSASSHKVAKRMAFEACSSHLGERDIEANGLDNGWSMTELYRMPDGGAVWYDGRGWQMRGAE